MYVMFLLRPFTVHNVFPCFYGSNKVIIFVEGQSMHIKNVGLLVLLHFAGHFMKTWLPLFSWRCCHIFKNKKVTVKQYSTCKVNIA